MSKEMHICSGCVHIKNNKIQKIYHYCVCVVEKNPDTLCGLHFLKYLSRPAKCDYEHIEVDCLVCLLVYLAKYGEV